MKNAVLASLPRRTQTALMAHLRTLPPKARAKMLRAVNYETGVTAMNVAVVTTRWMRKGKSRRRLIDLAEALSDTVLRA